MVKKQMATGFAGNGRTRKGLLDRVEGYENRKKPGEGYKNDYTRVQ